MPGENENMSAGTIKLTNGSTAVVGTSTTFTSDLKSGDVISTTISGVPYTLFVDTVTSNTALTLSDVFTGPTTTGAAYVAVPQMTLNRITAALAAQTAEAVRRVLQENANWQAFYSGTGDITVTLPDGTPTGKQVSGPSWAKLSGVANTAWIDRGQLATDANLNTMNPATTEGEWSKSSSTGLTTANGYPVGAGVGTLKVNNGGRYQGQQVYTDYTGSQWVRALTAAWNGTDGPWGSWVNTAYKALYATLITGSATDLNTLNNIDSWGTYRVSGLSGTTAALNYPYDGFGGYVEVGQGFSSYTQQTAFSTNGNMFTRYMSSATAWTAWVEIGRQPRATAFVGDAATLFDPGEYSTTTATTGLPTAPGTTAPPGGLLTVRMRASGAYTQEWIVFGSNPDIANQKFTRTYWSGAWQPWRQDLDDKSMYWVLGYGSSAMARATLDWQNDSFSIGESFYVLGSNMTNIPTGMDATTLNVDIHVRCGDGTGTRIVDVVYSTTTSAGYRKYELRLAGAVGARTINVRQVFTSADVVPLANGGTGATTAAAARTALGVAYGTTAGSVAAGNDSRITGALQSAGGNVNGSLVLNAPNSYMSNTAAARYAVGGVTYLDIWRLTQVDIGGVGTQGNLQFVANPGNYLSFELAPGNGSHSFRHDGKIVTNAGTVAFTGSDSRIKNKKGKPTGSARDRISTLAATATQDYLWLNYQGDINTYRYEQPQRGFIAQDAYVVDPTYASKPQNGADDEMPENGDAIWGVNTNAIVADLVIAVDEQQTDVEGLRKLVDAQQTQIAQLTSAIEQISLQIQAFSQPAAQS